MIIATGRKFIHILLGLILVIIGVAGLVLPILNGTVLLIVGFIILSFESPLIERKLAHITRKNATIYGWHLALDKILRKFFRK